MLCGYNDSITTRLPRPFSAADDYRLNCAEQHMDIIGVRWAGASSAITVATAFTLTLAFAFTFTAATSVEHRSASGSCSKL